MRDDHDELILRDLGKQRDYLLGRLRVKVSRRLVGENYRAVLRECARDDRPLLLSARELRALVVLKSGESDSLDKLKRALPSLLWRVDIRKRELYVLEHRKAINNVIVLEDERDVFLSVALPVALLIVRGRLALDIKLALLIGIHTAQHIEQRGLSASGFTRNGNEFTDIEIKIDSAKSDGYRALGNVDLADTAQ